MPLAGWMLIKEESLSAVYTLVAGVYGALGNTIGSAIAYGVGMRGGRPFLENTEGTFLYLVTTSTWLTDGLINMVAGQSLPPGCYPWCAPLLVSPPG